MSLSDDEAAKALKERTDVDAAKAKIILTTANGSSAGPFFLTSLHT
jgi:hypothetical protein